MPDTEMISNVNTPASSHLACRACGYSFAEGEPVSVRFVPLNGSMIESGAYHDRCVSVVTDGAYDGSRSSSPASGAPDEDVTYLAEDAPTLRRMLRASQRQLRYAEVHLRESASRLAAAEREREAMREDAERWRTWLTNLPARETVYIGHECSRYAVTLAGRMTIPEWVDSIRRPRAALSPTSPAPSPEERANGQ